MTFVPTDEELKVAERYRRWRAEQAPADCGLPAELSNEQLAWRRAQEKELRDLFGQEFAEDDVACFLGSGNCPFDAQAMEAILQAAAPVLERTAGAGETENGLWIFKRPEAGKQYVAFADVAGTLGLSRDAFQILERESGEQCAEYVGRIDAYAYGLVLANVAAHYNHALVAVETNLGDISNTVLRAMGNYPALYWHIASDEQPRIGWYTDSHNRPMMLDRFAKTLREHPELFHSSRLVAEAKDCERQGDRIQPRKGKTDDLVISAAGALAIRATGANAPQPGVTVITIGNEADDHEGWRVLGR